MFQVNDRVVLKELHICDQLYTNLRIGDRGKVVAVDTENEQVRVHFRDNFFGDETLNYDSETESYLINNNQLTLKKRGK